MRSERGRAAAAAGAAGESGAAGPAVAAGGSGAEALRRSPAGLPAAGLFFSLFWLFLPPPPPLPRPSGSSRLRAQSPPGAEVFVRVSLGGGARCG